MKQTIIIWSFQLSQDVKVLENIQWSASEDIWLEASRILFFCTSGTE